MCAGQLWARPQAVALGRPACAKRVVGRADQLRNYTVIPEFNFDVDVFGFGCLPT